MAEISKLSGVAIANVAKVDAVLKANIANINLLTIPSAAAFLLDTYTGAAAGYSTRRIASSATNLMRIREDSGDTETDIGYDSNGDLDTAAIATHCGSANGYVVTWYDQSGNANNATQGTSASQPQIYNGTAVITENGKPAIDFIQNSSRNLNGPTFSNNAIMGFVVNREVTNRGTIWGLGGSFMYKTLEVDNWSDKQTLVFKGDGTSFDNVKGSAVRDLSQHLITTSRFSNTLKSYVDGTLDINTTDSFSANSAALGFANRNTQGQLYLQEAVFWETDQDSNRTGIETNINDYFSIY